MVVVPFPFSDLSQTKRRPALVATDLVGDDLVLCKITSRKPRDAYAVEINVVDFLEGGLKRPSYFRTNRLFTADHRVISYKLGRYGIRNAWP